MECITTATNNYARWGGRGGLSLAVMIAGSACFPEAERPWLDETVESPTADNEVVVTEEPPVFVPPEISSFTSVTPTNVISDCPTTLSPSLVSLIGTDAVDFGIKESSLDGSDIPFIKGNEFALDVILTARERPTSVGCIEQNVGAGFGISTFQVSAMIAHAANVLGDPAWTPQAVSRTGGFAEALWAICALFVEPVENPDSSEDEVAEEDSEIESPSVSDICETPSEDLPEDLKLALGPILWAMYDGIAIRRERDYDPTVSARDGDWWRTFGGQGLLVSSESNGLTPYNAAEEYDRNYLTGVRGKLYGAAVALAQAIEQVDWSQFSGRADIKYDYKTPAGWVYIRDNSADEYPDTAEDVLLLLDLGGDDLYLSQVGSNTSGANAVSVAIDLGGNDVYTYTEARNAEPGLDRLPLDAYQTITTNSGTHVNASASESARQGAARNGIAFLFDMGEGNDKYMSLRASQGYAHQGVGVLFDAGGEDYYWAEDVSQGAAQFGIGLQIDLGSQADTRRSSHASQGFGFVAGLGVSFDAGGDDTYECDLSNGDAPAYPSTQIPESNANLCQGAGLGNRIRQVGFEPYSMAGGLGVLIDLSGNDRYSAGVYAQGVGYWLGLGLLSDRSGNDTYDGQYYVQGAGAHFGVGILADAGDGADTIGKGIEAETFSVGAAQDYSVAVFVNEAGNDTYKFVDRSGGVAACGSVSLFVDNQGTDTYEAEPFSAGISQCGQADSNHRRSLALFLDVGGDDAWQVSSGQERQGNGRRWNFTENPTNETTVVFAEDVNDGEGESGIHLE